MNRNANIPLTEAERVVAKIIDSGVLGNSARRASLLHYLVKKELSGRGAEIKAFAIAVDVLGRDASFDPNTDSIVRSEMGRLRDALRLYAAQFAAPDDTRIEIPKGTYRPVFATPAPERAPATARRRHSALFATALVALMAIGFVVFQFAIPGPEKTTTGFAPEYTGLPYEVIRIAVAPPKVYGEPQNADKIAIGLSAELMMDLSAYPWLSIIAPIHGLAALEDSDIDFVLDGEIFWSDETLESHMKLVAYPSKNLVWSNVQTVKLDAAVLRSAIVDVAAVVAFNLASARGIAPELTRAKNARVSPENLDAYLCYLGVHRYLLSPTDARHLGLRTCLLRAVQNFPEFGDAWAALALLYIDEGRFQTNMRAGADPWRDAKSAVEKALAFAPLRMPTLNAALIHSAEAPTPNIDEFNRVSDLLLNLFPKHPETLYNVGSRAAEFLGHWQDGMDLVDTAIELSPDPPSAFFLTRAYKAALDGDEDDALRTVEPLTSTTAVSQLLLNYIAATRNGLASEAAEYQVLLQAKGLSGHDDYIAHVKRRRYAKELEGALLRHLEQANQNAALR